MADHASVEKTVTESMLLTGEITIGAAEQSRLGFPDHSDAFDIVADGDKLSVAWTAGRRRLSGESLLDYLQDTARVGDLVRIERRGSDLSLVVHSPLRGFDATAMGPPPPSPATSAAAGGGSRRPPARRRGSRGGRFRLRQRDEYAWRDGVGFLKSATDHLLSALDGRGWDPRDAVEMRLVGEELATLDQFEELLALDAAHIEHMPHQEAAARTALTRLGGRAVLADEVGLGKTVEAGLVIKELLLRGLADRVLIVCPAPLRDQWRDELRAKFDEEFEVVTTGDAQALRRDRLIMTPQLAIVNAHRLTTPYDLVIVDEAHRLTGTNAVRTREVFGELLAAAPRALLLTATPVQNNLLELYRLVELLRPGTFRSAGEFTARYVDRDDPRRPVNAPELRRLVSSVVVRTTREQAGVDKVHRMPPRDQGVTLTAPERQLYDLIVETLRYRMRAPGDAMRRRSLALRLTASPQAISRSALRMGERHPDAELRKVLTEIGHLAADIRHTAREQAALAVIHEWLDEHGRVLVFTQHTETLLGIQRLLSGEGIACAPFHGGMAQSARARSVADFTSGAAPVLVSTDAGAEGQNLQVSNCVLNYDLPWNPMRVEQRIGRVHRLTQTRDVYIANLFARDTLDEAVYRLLHDKLAMFELLFGQVVTVLGELEGNQDSTMESRVLDALYEHSDAAMRQRLDELGRALEKARGRAVHMMTTGGDLNQWLAHRREERRTRAAQGQARELLPDAPQRPRRRQHDVEWFVREFLGRAGARIESPSDGFAVVTLTPQLSAALDDREQLYLAFNQAALDAHPDAELCVVGAEVFDEIMRALREQGDLTGTVVRIPEVDTRPRIAHVPQLSLIARRLEPAADWSARATFRVQEGAATGSQYITTVDIGTVPPPGPEREELPDDAPLPAGLTGDAVMAAIEDRAASQLRQDLARAQAADRERQREAAAQVTANLERQLDELERQPWRAVPAGSELAQRRGQLERALAAARQVAVTSETELRAELLTLELHGSNDLVAVETWRHSAGITREITYPWTPQAPELTCEATGDGIRTLALCAQAHAVEATALSHCQVCERDSCGTCGPGRAVSACVACGAGACGLCRDGGVLCSVCRNPEPAAELDRPGERGWRLGAGASLRVGPDHATLTAYDGTQTLVLPELPARQRVSAVAARLGLSASTGLRAGPAVPADEDLSAGALWCRIDRSHWWTTAADGGSGIDPAVLDVLPDLPGPAATDEADPGLGPLLAELRDRRPAHPAAALVAMPFVVVRRIDIEGTALVYREIWYDGTGQPRVAAVDRAIPEPSRHEPVEYAVAVAAASLGPVGVRIDRLHRSYLCHLTDGEHTALAFAPAADDLSVGVEATLARVIAEARLPARYLVVRHPWPGLTPNDLAAPHAAAGVTVAREHRVIWALVASGAGEPVTSAPPPGAWGGPMPSNHAGAAGLRQLLDRLSGDLSPVALAPCLTVEETWRSPYGEARRRYLVAPASPIRADLLEGRILVAPGRELSPNADDSTVGQPLSVDSRGHLHDPARAVDCPVCGHAYGLCCAAQAQVVACGECHRPACVECRGAGAGIAAVQCQRCGDRSCAGCSRTLTTTPCALCGRDVCVTCLSDADTCATCAGLAPAGEDEIAALPPVLAARGMTVLIGQDSRATVAVLLGVHRCEVAVIRDGEVTRWETARREPAALLRARLEVARLCGTGDVDVVAVTGEPVRLPKDVYVVRRGTRTELLWTLLTTEGWRAGNVVSLPGRPVDQPDEEVYADLAAAVAQSSPLGPVPAEAGSARELLERLDRTRNGGRGGATVTVCRLAVEDLVFLDSDGMHRLSNAGGAARETTAAWHPPDSVPDWAVEGWSPRPDVLAVAEVDEFSAAVAAIGRHALLGVRGSGGAVQWSPLNVDLDDVLRGALGAWLTGRTTLLAVTAMTTPASMRGSPVVLGARMEARETWPYAGPGPDGAAKAALHPEEVAWALGVAPGRLVAVPATSGTVPGPLRHALYAEIHDREVPRPPTRVGLRVRETWRFANGAGIVVEYLLAGGDTIGYLTDAATGEPLRAAQVCRSFHLVARVDVCTSCATATCRACPDKVQPCLVCGSATCGRCVAADRRCPTCARLRKVGAAGRLYVGVNRGDEAWSARNGSVKVTLRRTAGTWSVERTDRTGRSVTPLSGDRLTAVRAVLGLDA